MGSTTPPPQPRRQPSHGTTIKTGEGSKQTHIKEKDKEDEDKDTETNTKTMNTTSTTQGPIKPWYQHKIWERKQTHINYIKLAKYSIINTIQGECQIHKNISNMWIWKIL